MRRSFIQISFLFVCFIRVSLLLAGDVIHLRGDGDINPHIRYYCESTRHCAILTLEKQTVHFYNPQGFKGWINDQRFEALRQAQGPLTVNFQEGTYSSQTSPQYAPPAGLSSKFNLEVTTGPSSIAEQIRKVNQAAYEQYREQQREWRYENDQRLKKAQELREQSKKIQDEVDQASLQALENKLIKTKEEIEQLKRELPALRKQAKEKIESVKSEIERLKDKSLAELSPSALSQHFGNDSGLGELAQSRQGEMKAERENVLADLKRKSSEIELANADVSSKIENINQKLDQVDFDPDYTAKIDTSHDNDLRNLNQLRQDIKDQKEEQRKGLPQIYERFSQNAQSGRTDPVFENEDQIMAIELFSNANLHFAENVAFDHLNPPKGVEVQDLGQSLFRSALSAYSLAQGMGSVTLMDTGLEVVNGAVKLVQNAWPRVDDLGKQKLPTLSEAVQKVWEMREMFSPQKVAQSLGNFFSQKWDQLRSADPLTARPYLIGKAVASLSNEMLLSLLPAEAALQMGSKIAGVAGTTKLAGDVGKLANTAKDVSGNVLKELPKAVAGLPSSTLETVGKNEKVVDSSKKVIEKIGNQKIF